jgi:outer membrane protein assembly factor BamE (lipoprotein component of BamABCDE complex)
MKRLILVGLCLAVLVGCASTGMTPEQKQDVKKLQKGSEEERAEIAKKYDADEDLKQWEDQINAKELAKGMPKSAVLMAFGTPNLTEASDDGRTEKWFYRRHYDRSYTLYFKDNKLERWQARKYDRSR